METLTHEPLLLGECPRWDAEHRRLLFVDVLGGTVFHRGGDGDLQAVPVDGHVSAVVPVRGDEGTVLAAIDDGVAFLDLASGAVERLARLEPDRRGVVRMNDGACDPTGRFVVGSMAYDVTPGAGRLFRVDTDGSSEVLLEGCTIPNGLAWSADGATLYHVDSGPGTITAYAYGPGPLGEGRVIHRHDGPGAPDGMCVDAEGHLWVAYWGEGAVRRLTTDGEVLAEVSVPMQQPSACWFLRDRLVVTSATEGLSAPTDADGRTVMLDVGVGGVPAVPFPR